VVIKKALAGTVAAALALVGIVALSPAAQAAALIPTPVSKVADPETYHEFPGSQGSSVHATSNNPGRIWTDKTTFDHDVQVPADMEQAGIGPMDLDSDEMGVALSALGSTRHIRAEEQVPIDVSMVIDNSYSMIQCTGSTANCNGASGPTDWQNSRAYAMVQALDVAIGIIADDNAENRIAITQFGTNAGVLQALGAPVSFASGANAGHYVAISRAGNGAMTITLGNGQTLVVGTGTTGGAAQSTNI